MRSVQAKSKNDCVTLVRPSELPIYDDPSAADGVELVQQTPSFLETTARDARLGVAGFLAQYRDTYEYTQHVIETGKAHTASTIDQLQDETNLAQRAAFITSGGLAGLLVAALRRRGLVKRLLYTAVGLSVPAAVCYPRQLSHYGRRALDESYKGSLIAYNFLVGAKPETEFPETTPSAPKPEPTSVKSAPAPVPSEPKPREEPAASTKEPTTYVPPKPAKQVIAAVGEDHGQSNPEDADLYTTRG